MRINGETSLLNYWLIGSAIVVIAMLIYIYRRWAYESRSNSSFREWAWSIEEANQHAGKLLCEQLVVMAYFGEMLDHHGVNLEGSQFTQESTDLKELGHILRSMPERDNPWGLSWCQDAIVVLGDRYGIEPISGGPYSLCVLIRIAEAIMERVLVGNKQAAVAA